MSKFDSKWFPAILAGGSTVGVIALGISGWPSVMSFVLIFVCGGSGIAFTVWLLRNAP